MPASTDQEEWDRFWLWVADAADEALREISPTHPDLHELRQFVAHCRVAGGRPVLRLVGPAA